MTFRTNPTIVVKIIDLDTIHIYSRNHMVEMDKISFSVGRLQFSNSMKPITSFSPQIVGSCYLAKILCWAPSINLILFMGQKSNLR